MANQIRIAEKKPVAALKTQVRIAAKNAGMLGSKHQVKLVVDVSPSMEFPGNEFFRTGIVEGIVSRALALGMTFDDNGAVEVYALNDRVSRMPDITASNLDGYVDRELRRLIDGGTNYAPTINAIVRDMEPGDPALVLFFTDGDNGDKSEATRAIQEAAKLPIFFQFFGMKGKGRAANFDFLERLDTLQGRVIDNCGFSEVPLYDIADEQLYELILHEYKDFPRKAQAAGLLDGNLKWDGRRASGGIGSRLGSLFGRS